MKKVVLLIPLLIVALVVSGCNESITAPTDLAIDDVDENRVVLSWKDQSDNESGFEIERALEGGDFRILQKTAANIESFSDTTVVQGEIYAYRVRAFNDTERSNYSNTAYADTNVNPQTVPAAPGPVHASNVTTTSLVLSWVDNSDNEAGFEIQRSMSSDFTDADNFTADTNEASFTDDGLTPNTTYYYRMKAYNDVGDSEYTDTLEVRTEALPELPPEAPSGLEASALSPGSISLSWDDNSDNETGFIVMVSLDGSEFETAHTTANNQTTFTHNGLLPQTVYHYKVVAFNDAGQSAATSVVEAETPSEPVVPPQAPAELGYTDVTSNSARLSWSDMSDNEEGFNLEKSQTEDFSLMDSFTLNPDTVTYLDTNLLPSTDYYYRASAFNEAGESEYSNVVHLHTADAPVELPAPTSLGLQEASPTMLIISWQDNSDVEDGFIVERSIDGGQSFEELVRTSTDRTSHTDTGLTPETTYLYRVKAFYGDQTSDYSNTLTAVTTDEEPATGSTFIADYTIAKESVLRRIPTWAIEAAKDNLNIMYCGTSHSSQTVDGMRGLMEYKNGDAELYHVTFNGTPTSGALNMHYRPSSIYSAAQDLSHDSIDADGHTAYFRYTVSYLDATPDCNVVMWSWCSIGGHDVSIYLDNFAELIDMYRAGGSKGRGEDNAVDFVFMTGYSRKEGDTPEPPYLKTSYQNHKRIVDYCRANGYFCLDYWSQDTYDYGDDSYNPTEDGNINLQHLAYVESHELGTDWFYCRSYSSGGVSLPAHANQHLTGNRRAYAAWWIFARLAGWDGTLE